jgi:hypothetical protein
MHCFKLTVHEDRFANSSSRKVLIKTMREACKALHQMPNGQTGFCLQKQMFFPKSIISIPPISLYLTSYLLHGK